MKKWFTLSLALVAAAVSHAVTVAWTVPNSDEGNWVGQISKAYYVYSTAPKTVEAVHGMVDFRENNTAYMPSDPVKGDKYGLWGSLTLPEGAESDNSVFMYLVIANGNGDYAVAGGIELTYNADTKSYTNLGEDTGVYQTGSDGQAPDYGEYFDVTGWLGGTWRDALVPEPTVMALLALGVAGVALRRKKNLTK